jgi:hypothetical protein
LDDERTFWLAINAIPGRAAGSAGAVKDFTPMPEELIATTTLVTSQGPTQPPVVSCTRFNKPDFLYSVLTYSTGTLAKPRSVLPQYTLDRL